MFKKMMVALTLVLLGSLSVPCFAATQGYDFYKSAEFRIGDTKASVNSTAVTMDSPAYFHDGAAFVSCRFLANALGADVAWDSKTKRAELKLSGTDLILSSNSQDVVANKKTIEMSQPTEIRNGQLMVPLRFVSESFGADVFYNAEDKSILLRRIDFSKWVKFSAPNGRSYVYPAGWSMMALEDTPAVVEVKTPNGATMDTFTAPNKPSTYLAKYQKQYTDLGWTASQVSQLDAKNIDSGYMVIFQKTDKPGTTIYSIVRVTPYKDGSQIGQISFGGDVATMDPYILGQIITYSTALENQPQGGTVTK